ncbi:Xanthine dehydrogenase molybdenum-binding subunit [Pseudovibrio axinellae]|uniref:Xanthine dehydrogenase molybdenum-binding subunit n=1 Tax=Pseudovibrio axinellae TaxID=989403 RepID=A0A165XC29_9HYPH|nr:xanthine dehydrogenase molybdopterin binding subunit [Pseudovibrio axinellae]KZL17560.1 Xanthine dehydrogenase molybdenum-binding subunit [Pseudovibrio axinellae]SER32701.1 xanthine dehydrogenase, molybdenum binding subunit apoprotein [Pseudovibrio axinellae]
MSTDLLETRVAENNQLQAVGQPHKHDSARKHVSGKATYIDDMIEPVGTLHVAPGYSTAAACGRITKIDLAAVRAAPGVVAVLEAGDIPGVNDCSPAMGDDPVLVSERIAFHGQLIFLIVAQTRLQARKAAKLAHIDVQAEAALISVADALKADQTVLPDYEFRRGSPEAKLERAAHTVRSSFALGGQEHFYLEGQVAFAFPGEDGDMTVHSSTQHPTEVQHTVAKVLGVDEAEVTVEVRRMGGAFGGKESQANQWAALAALAAHATGRPCKCRLDRDDDMILTGKRHDFLVDLDAGYDGTGKIEAVKINLNSRCGHSADLSLGINDRAMFHADNSYYYTDLTIRSKRLKTNTVSNTAFRGFGGPQGMFAAERMMDAIAIKLGLDPLDVRKVNFYREGENTTPYGQPVEEHELLATLVDQLEASCAYRARRKAVEAFNAENKVLKKGIALTPVKFGISFTLRHLNQAGALVHLYRDGSVHLNHGGTEMGQGLYQKVAQITATEMGVPLSKVKITATNTSKVANTSPTAASSGTDLNGMAAAIACREIVGRLKAFVAERFDVSETDIEFLDDQVFISGEAKFSIKKLAQLAYENRIHLSSSGFYKTPKIIWDRDKVEGRPFFYFSYGASCSEVLIDTLTGEMKVERVDVLHDVGKSLNPALDIGQIEGGFVQGMGWLTSEELWFDDVGRLRTHAPSTYKIPTASDVPEEFNVSLFESEGNPEETIYRSKAVGEPPLMLPISVFCAINDAIASLNKGVLPKLDAPATPEAILNAVQAIKRGEVD